MTNIEIIQPETGDLTAQNQSLFIQASTLAVIDKMSHQAGSEILKDIARAEKIVVERFAEPKQAAHKAHKFITQMEGMFLEAIKDARSIISPKLIGYETEQRRIAEAKQRELAELARKQEEERLLQDAIDAEASGDKAGASAILEEPISAPVVTVAPETAKVDGVSTRTVWRAELTDKMRLLKYVVEHPEWLNLIEVNLSALNALARSQKGAFALPGTKAVSESIKAVRA